MRYHLPVRVVVDTNVFVAAVSSRHGASREVLRRCLLGEHTPILGEALFLEYEATLGREETFLHSTATRTEREILFAAFAKQCEWTRIHYLWRPNLRDEGDNHILELAIAGNAKAIVTHNIRDFRGGDLRFPPVRVLRPAALIMET